MKQLIFEFIFEYGQNRAFGSILPVKDLCRGIGPGNSCWLALDRRPDHLLNSDFAGRLKGRRRRSVEAADVPQADKLEAITFGVGSPHELAARFRRGID